MNMMIIMMLMLMLMMMTIMMMMMMMMMMIMILFHHSMQLTVMIHRIGARMVTCDPSHHAVEQPTHNNIHTHLG